MRATSLTTLSLRSLSLLGALVAVGCASADPGAGFDESTGATGAVDLAAINANQIKVVQDGSVASKATGAIYVPFLAADHSQINVGSYAARGTCGVTFVSPHYAITSSHCFNDTNAYAPATQTFVTKTFDVSSANVDDFYFDSAMTGTFPNYTPIFGHTADQAAGYSATSFNCKIASRCQYPWAGASDYNCDVAASDVTVLYCSGRSDYGAWIPIANDAATNGGAVYMYWFHELFMASANNTDMATHYTNVVGGDLNNFHYVAAPSNVLLPFTDLPWSNGTQRTRLGNGGDGDVKTDLYGCHGSSGSGILTKDSSGNFALLGPAHAEGGSGWGGKLCDSPTNLVQNAANGGGLTFNSNTSVNAIVNSKWASTIQLDRTRWIIHR
ncbi:MAG TPA: hypothetical protein VF407_16600 [Polyangiaceae bacterium]